MPLIKNYKSHLKYILSYCFFCCLAILVFSGCNVNEKRLPSLRETYGANDKNPFGAFVAAERLADIFPDHEIEISNVPADEDWFYYHKRYEDDNYSLYFMITKNLVLSDAEATNIIAYVKDGNDLFISADYIDPSLLENIFTSVSRIGEITAESKGVMTETHVGMYFSDQLAGKPYPYYYFPFLNYISNYEEDFTRVLGVNEKDQPNYALYFVGAGRIYLHLAPRAFSNYFLLSGDNYEYFENVIAYLRPEPGQIYWDAYYKNFSEKQGTDAPNDSFSSMQVINSNPPLLWAFWLAVAGMLLFVLFNFKRKQKVIPEIKPKANATVAFTETIGRLYFQHKDNRRIADKMITFLNENIRNRYFINTNTIDEGFVNSLAGKTGLGHEEINNLFSLIKEVQTQETLADELLLELNIKIDHFNKHMA